MIVAHQPQPPAQAESRTTRLRVVTGAQDCSTCCNMQKCWKADEGNMVLNLLVCRYQRGIDQNKSAKLILLALRPKLRKIAHWVSQRSGAPMADVLTDVESRVLEQLLYKYVMGELVPPVVWLFHAKYGGIRHWAMRTTHQALRDRQRNISYDAHTSDDEFEDRLTALNNGKPPELPSPESPGDGEDVARRALTLVQDGRTLTTAEYRVLAFDLGAARGAAHKWLSAHMGVERQRVSLWRATAVKKIGRLVRASTHRRPLQGDALLSFVAERPAPEVAVELGKSVRWVYYLKRAAKRT